jgi:hypothetical protein
MPAKKTKEPDQDWFWSKKWQRGEALADADIQAGRLSGPFRNTAELTTYLQGDNPKRQ